MQHIQGEVGGAVSGMESSQWGRYNESGNLYRQIFLSLMLGRESGAGRKKLGQFSFSSEERIGKGYSSVVYRGCNDHTNETVAIKAIDMKGVRDAVSREMLDCEIQALSRLKHPNILKCYEVIREPSHCYILTEYCDQGDLSALLKKKRRLTEPEVLRLAKDIIAGFVEMADKQFLHRDLKLANIFMSGGRAVIADFGFAKKHANVFEREKYNVGSPLYMSPEALKRNIYSVKNDIWSIGIMLYELLHGETPWECKTEKELVDKMVRVPIRFKDNLVTEPTRQFIKKCLEVNEEQRMSLADLKHWNSANSYDSLRDGMIYHPTPTVPALQLTRQPLSTKQPNVGQSTNRVSTRSQSNYALHSKSSKEVAVRQNSSVTNGQKESALLSQKTVGKVAIEKNNNILILEINTFRLLYKIHEKLKKYASKQRELISALGNEVVRRVGELMAVVVPEKENLCSLRGEEFGLLDVKQYLNEEANPSIKKYKSVLKEYHKKYSSEISIQAQGRQLSSKALMREVLAKGFLRSDAHPDEVLLAYWMLEYLTLTKEVKKEYLDSVIEPKTPPNATTLHQRLLAL